MRRVLCIMSAFTMLFLVACGNVTESMGESSDSSNSVIEKIETEHEEKEEQVTVQTPTVMTDLFDGQRRLWFYIEKDKEIAYDTGVVALLITEDKTVSKLYYNLVDPRVAGSSGMVGAVSGREPNPFFRERFVLSDFEGLSDDEIIEKVSQSYADAFQEYSLTYTYAYKSQSFSLPKAEFPHAIRYGGELDSSGNKLKEETLSFSNQRLTLPRLGEGFYTYTGAKLNLVKFEIASIVRATEIKDKVYVGLANSDGYRLVTINNYSSFGNIAYDDPSNATEW